MIFGNYQTNWCSWNLARKKGKNLTPSNYVADIGCDIRKDDTGGGGTLSSNSMKIMGVIGMDVYFSEYPSSDEK